MIDFVRQKRFVKNYMSWTDGRVWVLWCEPPAVFGESTHYVFEQFSDIGALAEDRAGSSFRLEESDLETLVFWLTDDHHPNRDRPSRPRHAD